MSSGNLKYLLTVNYEESETIHCINLEQGNLREGLWTP